MMCPPDDTSSAGFLYVPSGAGIERRGVTAVAAHGRAAGIAPSRPRDRAATREALRRAEAVQSAELPLRGGRRRAPRALPLPSLARERTAETPVRQGGRRR